MRGLLLLALSAALASTGTGASAGEFFLDVDKDFPARQQLTISRAAQILNARFFATQIMRRTYAVARFADVSRSYYKDNKFARAGIPVRDVLRTQVDVLARMPFRYRLKIKDYTERSPYSGYAKGNHDVDVEFRGDGSWRVEDDPFEVYLNRVHLQRNSDPRFWAGVIAHEVLHNLGHSHGENDYSPNQQIVAFDRAVSGYDSHWLCGRR